MTSISDNHRVLVYSRNREALLKPINIFMFLGWQWEMRRMTATSPGGDQVFIACIENIEDAYRFAGLWVDGVVCLDAPDADEGVYRYLRALVRARRSDVPVSIR